MPHTNPCSPLLAIAAALFCACRPTSIPAAATPAQPPLTGLTSNILRADYAGSAACGRCHAELSRAFLQSPMHHMTRLPQAISPAELRAPFSGSFHFKDDWVRFEEKGAERFMRIESRKEGVKRFRITKVIGGHHREDFAGIEVGEDDSPVMVKGRASGTERVLPASYSLTASAWRYKGYSVMTAERPGLRPGAVWSRTCIFCHNTEPYLSTILGALAGPGTPPYQGEVVDSLLPEARRASFQITDPTGLARAVSAEIGFLGGRPLRDGASLSDVLTQAINTTRARFGEPHLIEVGIGCESCHLGSRAHVDDTSILPSLTPISPLLRVQLPTPSQTVQQTRAQAINRACARCHQVLFSQYPWTWEGGRRKGPALPGGSQINSGEGRDFLLGGCSLAMSCVTCHDPHAPDNAARMEQLEGQAGDAICQSCHTKYRAPEAISAHTHHSPTGPGARCFGCHMPKKNMSLDNRLTRYHRIGSPTDQDRVERDRPLECALCHPDKRVSELVSDMERFWNKSYDKSALTTLYGALDANVLRATLTLGKPHEQATAIALLGDHRARDSIPLIAAQLTHPYPIVRYYAVNALAAILGRKVEIDLFQDNAKIHADAEALLKTAGEGVGSLPPAPAKKSGSGGVEVDED